MSYYILTKQLCRCPKYQVHCSELKSKVTLRKQSFKLAHRNPVIIAVRRGGQVVKMLVKSLRLDLALYTGALWRMFAGTDTGVAHDTNSAMQIRDALLVLQHKSVTCLLPPYPGAEWACIVGCILKQGLTCAVWAMWLLWLWWIGWGDIPLYLTCRWQMVHCTASVGWCLQLFCS